MRSKTCTKAPTFHGYLSQHCYHNQVCCCWCGEKWEPDHGPFLPCEHDFPQDIIGGVCRKCGATSAQLMDEKDVLLALKKLQIKEYRQKHPDIRPNCIECGEPWMPPEGVDAQIVACSKICDKKMKDKQLGREAIKVTKEMLTKLAKKTGSKLITRKRK